MGDLLTWNAAFDSTRLGGPGLRDEQERRAVLTGGRTITYAAGLFVTDYKGTPVVRHDGATAGYRAFLARFPQQRVSVAVLCNAGNANASQLGYAAAEQFLDLSATAQDAVGTAAPTRASVPAAAIADKAGLYRNLRNMIAQRFVLREGRLETEAGVELVPRSPTLFVAASDGIQVHFTGRADRGYDLRIVTPAGDTVPADRVLEADTSRAALAEYVGTWHSDEADATLRISQESDGRLMLRREPDLAGPLRPIYRDGFRMPFGVLVFRRDADGRISELRLTASRVRNLRFIRTSAP